MAVKRWLATLALVGAWAFGCRNLSVCATPSECTAADNAASEGGGGGVAESSGGADGKAEAVVGVGGRSEGGAGAGAVASGGDGGLAGLAGASTEVTSDACPPGRSECDASSLTHCETSVHYSIRHCGACGDACDGVCVLGKCKAPQELFSGGDPFGFVATQTNGFAIIPTFENDSSSLYMFDLASGTPALLTQLSSERYALSLGTDRLYVQDGGTVLEFELDGQPISQNALDSVQSFGATANGVYYVLTDYDVPVWRLYYRPSRSADAQLLREGGEFTILGSALSGVALVDGAYGDEVRALSLLADGKVRPLGTLPAGWTSLRVVQESVAVLVPTPGELWWFNELGESHYGVGRPALSGEDALNPAPSGVALQLQEGGDQFVQLFDKNGPQQVRMGVSRHTNAVFLDQSYLWYLHAPNWLDAPKLLRSRRLEANDL